jgi:hypothetical protein
MRIDWILFKRILKKYYVEALIAKMAAVSLPQNIFFLMGDSGNNWMCLVNGHDSKF